MFPRQRPKINPPPFSPALSQTTCHTPLSPSLQGQLSPFIAKSENNPGHCTRPSARLAPHQGPPLGDPGPCPLPAAGPGATSLPLHSPPPPLPHWSPRSLSPLPQQHISACGQSLFPTRSNLRAKSQGSAGTACQKNCTRLGPRLEPLSSQVEARWGTATTPAQDICKTQPLSPTQTTYAFSTFMWKVTDRLVEVFFSSFN